MKAITATLLLLSLTACSQTGKTNKQNSNLTEAEARKAVELEPTNSMAHNNLASFSMARRNTLRRKSSTGKPLS
jgi:Flp pilus assembly protein TadD